MRIFYVVFLSLFSFTVCAQIWDIDNVRVLPGAINTEYEESLPIFSSDSSKLYFVRTFDPRSKGGKLDQDIWVSFKDESDGYSEGKQVASLNSKYNNAVVGLSKDGLTLYLLNVYDGKKDLEKGISVTHHKGKDSWSKPEKLEIPNLKIEGDYYGFHINQNEDVLLISHKGLNTLGEEDLYVSLKTNGNWSEPENLGSVINTTGFEMSPFLSPNNDTLFFSSNGHAGFGGADIFYSVRGSSWTDWSKPVNLGEKINSPKFDACFSYNGNTLYWSSNRNSEFSDLYTATFIQPDPLTASAVGTDVTTHKGSDGRINLTVYGGVAPFTFLWSNGAKVEDPTNLVKDTYSVVVTDAIGQVAKVTVDIDEPGPPVEVIEVGKDLTVVLKLEPIYFDLNSSYIRADAKKELDKIVASMNENPSMVIECGSHTDCRESAKYNLWLSDRRAKSTVEYIANRITDPSRITGQGYGETKLINKCECEGEVVSDCSEEEHQLNRRTEFIVVKK
jgi:outer membrane protein OmpA-like peptidoglycan-associated protein